MADIIDFKPRTRCIETEWGTDWLDFDGVNEAHARALWNVYKSADPWKHFIKMKRRCVQHGY